MKTYSADATLGNLVKALEEVEESRLDHLCAFVLHGLPALYFEGLCSYRGYYEDLAIILTQDRTKVPTIRQVREQLILAQTSTYHGWKGGEYRMSPSSNVWVTYAPGMTSYLQPLWEPRSLEFNLVSAWKDPVPDYIYISDDD